MYRIHDVTTVVFLMTGLFFLHAGQPLLSSAADPICDPGLTQRITDDLGYQLRGDRCEGLYARDVGGSLLLLVSLTSAFEGYDLNSGENLIVEWNAPLGRHVHLRAYGLRPRLYYRMDTIRPVNNTPYHWPIDLLANFNIPRCDLGVVGWTTSRLGKNERRILLPLHISQQKRAAPSQGYRLILWPGKELAEVYLSIATVNADGSLGRFLKDGYPLHNMATIRLSGELALILTAWKRQASIIWKSGLNYEAAGL